MELVVIVAIMIYLRGMITWINMFSMVGTDTDRVDRFYRFGYILGVVFWPIIYIIVRIPTVKKILDKRL